LEDLARIAERGIYDLQAWVEGMKYLPPVVEIPSFFKLLGFTSIPADAAEVKDRYRTLAKQMHPDTGGNVEDFIQLQKAAEQALKYFDSK
jgi:DnaJ-class molecular chaperone